MPSCSRRRFLLLAASALGTMGFSPRLQAGPRLRGARGPHPEPRPGTTAEHVLTADQLSDSPEAIDAFEKVREIPEIIDGIRCQCGCAGTAGRYSLLSCYESDGMARDCPVCQGQARLAYRLHKGGKSLAEIRNAIDARYG